MSVIAWEEPPRPRGYRQHTRDTLRTNPGEWALVDWRLPSAQSAYNLQRYFRDLGCEAKTRKQHDRTWSVWARWPA